MRTLRKKIQSLTLVVAILVAAVFSVVFQAEPASAAPVADAPPTGEYVVFATAPLRVREAVWGEILPQRLGYGDEVTVTSWAEDADGNNWAQIGENQFTAGWFIENPAEFAARQARRTAARAAPAAAAPAGNGLRYDNAGRLDGAGNLIDSGCQLPGIDLAPGQSETVAYIICHSSSPTDAWIKIQGQLNMANTQGVITAPSHTEVTQALPIGQAWVVWNSTCPAPSSDTPQDVPVVTRDIPGNGCIRFIPEYGGGARTYSFEQAFPVW